MDNTEEDYDRNKDLIVSDLKPHSNTTIVPIVDLSGFDSDRRSVIVDQITRTVRKSGHFQIINHGIPSETIDRTIAAIRAFHEQPTEVIDRFYKRNKMENGVSYIQKVAGRWMDTLQVRMAPNPPAPELLPEICRKEVVDWDTEMVRLGEVLMGLMSEGLGLSTWKLKEMTCLEARVMVGHYYPYCPQPDPTVGLASHTDPKLLTVLIQDQTGGLQVKSGEVWVDVKPVSGALIINVGDLFQIISNDEYKSVEHRVLGSSSPRLSVVYFFNPGKREELYGPLPALVSPEKPALYRQFTLSEFIHRFLTKELDGKTLKDYYKL